MNDYADYHQVEIQGVKYLAEIDTGYAQTHEEPGEPPHITDLVIVTDALDTSEQLDIAIMNQAWQNLQKGGE